MELITRIAASGNWHLLHYFHTKLVDHHQHGLGMPWARFSLWNCELHLNMPLNVLVCTHHTQHTTRLHSKQTMDCLCNIPQQV